MPIIKRSEEELKMMKELELEKISLAEKEREKQRNFELTKTKIETSAPKRWEAVGSIFYDLFAIPAILLMVVTIGILCLFKREVPRTFENYIDSHS